MTNTAPTQPKQGAPPSNSMLVNGLEVLGKAGEVNTYIFLSSQNSNKRDFFFLN